MSNDYAEDQVVWVRVANYFSKFIVPACLVTVSLGVIYAYANIRENSLNVRHNKESIDRVSTEHNSRIMTNQIGLEKTNEKVYKLEVLLPQILSGVENINKKIDANKKYQRDQTKELSELKASVAVIKDREERKEK